MFDLYQKLLSQLELIWLIVLAVWHIWQCIWSIGGAVVDYCESGQVRRDSNRDNGRSQISRNTNKTSKQWQKVQALSWCVSVQKRNFVLYMSIFSFTFFPELMSEIPSQAPVISVYPVGPSLGLRNEIFLAVHCCSMYNILMQFSFTGVNVCITLVPCSATKNVEIRTFIRK